MNESLLDVVFEDDEVVFRNYIGYRVGERRKTTDIWGRDRHVAYYDEFGKVVSTAREIRPLFGGTPYVEFYDKNKKPRGRAYITEEILSGKRKIEYTNNDGKTLSSRYVNEEKVLRNNAVSMEAAAGLEKQPGGTTEFSPSTPLILCLLVFLGIGLYALLTYLHDRMDTIIHYGSTISVYAVCPLMVVLFLLLCRTKKPTLGLRIFHFVHLVVFAAGCALLAYLSESIFLDRDFNFFPQITNTFLLGLLHFQSFFAPTLVFGVVSGILTLLSRRTSTSQQREHISRSSMKLMQIGNLLLISVSLAITTLTGVYGSGGISALLTSIMMLLLLSVFIGLACALAYVPYSLFSKGF